MKHYTNDPHDPDTWPNRSGDLAGLLALLLLSVVGGLILGLIVIGILSAVS